MEEPVGAQFAIQIALNTLKDRCRSLQQRVASLEEENLHLRVQCGRNKTLSTSTSDVDQYKEQIAKLTEQKEQLLNKMKMVTTENQELWSKLGQLTKVNENLDSQLNKINDSLVQYTTRSKEGHSPLIRSKTFTQDEPQTKVLQKNLEENGKICSELEEISLKIISSFAQGKNELESLYSEIADAHYNENFITDSCGFYYGDFDDNILGDFDAVLEELRSTKETCIRQKQALKLVLEKISDFKESSKKHVCDCKVPKQISTFEKGTCTQVDTDIQESLSNQPVSNNYGALPQINDDVDIIEMICPVCCKNFFGNKDFHEFEVHVEKHFTDAEPFEIL